MADGVDVLTCGRGGRPGDLASAAAWVQADVASPADAGRIIAAANERFGPVGILVNNAGVQLEKTASDTTDGDWDLVMGVNARGTFNLWRAVLPQMQTDGGVIVNIGSISGMVSDPSMAIYNA